VSFALGTDTAGSGRVPAAFNNIVGLKPTRGLLSSGGVVPACRSLDCVSIFGLTSADVGDVLDVARGFDPADPFSRPGPETTHEWADGEKRSFRFGVPAPEQLEFFGNDDGRGLFEVSLRKLEELGGVRVAVNLRPFLEAAHLLYNGPWLAERYAAIRDFIDRQPEALHPVTRQVIQGGATPSAADAFTGYYRLKELKRETASVWSAIDVLVTPTAGNMYSIGEVDREPLRLNSNLGYYTNFVNLLDLCALAVPGGFQSNSLPFGVTLVAPAFQDSKLVALGDAMQLRTGLKLGATNCTLPDPENHTEMASREGARTSHLVRLAVCGAHMSGLPLNHQLTQRQSRLLRACRTAPHYRLYALENCQPLRPGLIRSEPGHAIEVEVWVVPVEHFGSFVDAIPSPLGIGTVELEDGEQVRGFLCETYAIANARDISELGGWRAYLAARQS
jgi:allophanate hydrolase